MSCSKFQLLDLPYLALQHVTNLMEPIDILDFSLCSKRAKRAALSHRLKPSHCNLVTRTTFDKRVCVEVVFSEHVKLTWMFSKEFVKKKMFPGVMVSARRVEGSVYETNCKCSTTNTIITFGAPLESSLLTVTSYILSLFRCSVQNIELDINFFSNLNSLSHLTVFRKCEKLRLRANRASTQKVEQVLTIITGFESLDMVGYEGDELACEKINKLSELKLNDAYWLSSNKLLELNCRKVELGENNLDFAVLNELLKKWMRGEMETLEYLTVNIEHVPTDDLHRIFNGIQLAEWDSNSRHGYYRKDATTVYDCRNGRDIVRDDGKIATVTFVNFCLVFLVWHQTCPDFSLPHGMFYTRNPKQPILSAEYLRPTIFYTTEDAEREFEFIY